VVPEGTVARYRVPGSASVLAQAMYDAATSPSLAEVGRAARAVVCQYYSMSRPQEDYEALYRELLNRNSTRV
jgi:hypothetical protein